MGSVLGTEWRLMGPGNGYLGVDRDLDSERRGRTSEKVCTWAVVSMLCTDAAHVELVQEGMDLCHVTKLKLLAVLVGQCLRRGGGSMVAAFALALALALVAAGGGRR